MKPRIPFSSATAFCLRLAADHREVAEHRRDMWRDAVWERGRDYSRAGNWWWPLPWRVATAPLREAQ